MKTQHFLFISALFLVSLSSCSTYKNTTTPDDVYYSPGQPVQTTVTQPNNNSDYYSTPNENYVKMRVQNPDKWAYFDDYNTDYYGYSPYGYGSAVSMSMGFATGPCYGGFGYNSPMSYYNSYYAWNNFYNPYYGGVVIVNGKNTTTPSYTRMSNFNPSAYRGSYYNARPSGTHFTNTSSTRNSPTYYNSHSNNSNSNIYRSSDSHPSYSPATRSSNSIFSSGGGGGGGASRGGGGGGGFSRPSR